MPSGSDLKTQAEDAAKVAAEAVAEQAALDIAARAFCRLAVPGLLAPLELLEDVIPLLVSSTFSSTLPLPSLCHFQFKADYCPCKQDLGHCRDYCYPSTHQSVCQGR